MRASAAGSLRHGSHSARTNPSSKQENTPLLSILDNSVQWPAHLAHPTPAYEAEVERIRSCKKPKDPANNMLLFPDDDWSVVKISRTFRTVDIPVPPKLSPTAPRIDTPAQLRVST